jgi:hypothetical protein
MNRIYIIKKIIAPTTANKPNMILGMESLGKLAVICKQLTPIIALAAAYPVNGHKIPIAKGSTMQHIVLGIIVVIVGILKSIV